MTATSTPSLRTTVTHRPGYVVLALAGVLDAATTPQMLAVIDTLTNTSARRIVIDASQLGYATPDGLSALNEAYCAVAVTGVSLVLAEVQPLIWTALQLTPFANDLTTYDTVAGAGTDDPEQRRVEWL